MRFLLILVLVFFSSCHAEEFSVSSASLSYDSAADAHTLETAVSQEGNTYTYRLTSPDGDLRWEGAMTGEGDVRFSDSILITPGAAFPEGSYHLILYSDSGSEVSLDIPFTVSGQPSP